MQAQEEARKSHLEMYKPIMRVIPGTVCILLAPALMQCAQDWRVIGNSSDTMARPTNHPMCHSILRCFNILAGSAWFQDGANDKESLQARLRAVTVLAKLLPTADVTFGAYAYSLPVG